MKQPEAQRTEFLLRYTRQLAFVCLIGLLPALFYGVLTVWDRDGHYERLQLGLLLLSPIILTLGLAWVMASRKGVAIPSDDPDLQAIAQDEFRRLNAMRAVRVAFVTVLFVQLPLAWLLGLRPSPDSLAHMGTLTCFLGFISFLSAFLFFDRD
ncbi:MAG: hypothetical protein ACOYNX_05855 [Geothrix sp.]